MKKTLVAAGFTAIELLVAIAVLTIFIAIAVPDYSAIIQNNAIRVASNDLMASVLYARSEAIKRNVPVSICATADQTFTSCGSNWRLGWLVFANPTGGTSLVTPALRVINVSNPNVTVTFSPSRNIITYRGTGFTAAGTGAFSATVKSSGCSGNAGRILSVSAIGNPTLTATSCP